MFTMLSLDKVQNNRIDTSFGPAGTSAGIFLLLVGIIVSCVYPSALVLILIGGFVGFTGTSAQISYTKKQVRFSTNIFGFIPVGKWVQVDLSMKIGIRESHQRYRAYSWGNRTLDITRNDFRLILLDSQGKEVMPLKKFNTIEAALMDLKMMSDKLGLTILQGAQA